jgi:hypothetical protein
MDRNPDLREDWSGPPDTIYIRVTDAVQYARLRAYTRSIRKIDAALDDLLGVLEELDTVDYRDRAAIIADGVVSELLDQREALLAIRSVVAQGASGTGV